MARTMSGDLELTPIEGDAKNLSSWVSMFHLAAVVVDPYTYESSWILDSAARILDLYGPADCRTAFVVTAPTEETRTYVGPLAERYLILSDPGRKLVEALDVDTLPAFAVISNGLVLEGVAEGWNPPEWKTVAGRLSELLDWTEPLIPGPGDPAPYLGAPAAG